MASPTRARTRKATQSKEKARAEIEPTAEELSLAAAQENAELQGAQMQFLTQRVGNLRIRLNRANKEIERLGGDPII